MKKSTSKYLFVARGPGETGQARSLAKYIAQKKGKIVFCLLQEKNRAFVSKDKEFKIYLTKAPKELAKVIKKEKPKVLLMFNSKTWALDKDFQKKPDCLSIGVDSNWLFNNQKYPAYPFIEWLDEYFVLFPEKIFSLGLKNFKIKKHILKRITPVGFIPTSEPVKDKERIRKKYKIKDEKLIFAYFSGFGAAHRKFALDNLLSAVEKLRKKNRKIKVLYIGPQEGLEKELNQKWILKKEKLPCSEYFKTLASSDLVFQHQGMVTLSQAISAQIPVICNVSLLKASLPKIHFWEVVPFQRAKMCKMFSKSSSAKKIARTIAKLLYNKKERNKMIKAQRKFFKKGEEKAYQLIQELL